MLLLLSAVVGAGSGMDGYLSYFEYPYDTYESSSLNTINREYFIVKIFSDSLACAKIKCTKIHIDDNAVQGPVCLKII